jgi:N-methylhydantoinase A/oxoprolinase/acetone carboxylase beta subunit
MLRIGVDTGGTFTDFVAFDGKKLHSVKLPSTPRNPSVSIEQGLAMLGPGVFEMVHGTTVGTNAFLQKKLARGAFLCTRGFEHLLFIGRQNRINLFSLQVRKPFHFVPLSCCFGIDERTLADGTVLKEVRDSEILSLAEKLKRKKIEGIGLLFLHSYRNPLNEIRAARILREAGFQVTASSEIMPEYREYERAVVTMLNSSLKPVIAKYIGDLRSKLGENRLAVMQANGGVLSPERISREPVRTITSGPAGGVIAAKRFSDLKKIKNIITLDMGGTSTDVSLIKEGNLSLTRDAYLENLPLRIPVIDIVTVGAGGGSIARVDRGGVLQVGPDSAGADPGPACYGRSRLPTVTDAWVVNGLIHPELFLGGHMKIYPERSTDVIRKIAGKIGKSIHETAEGIIDISVSSMEKALRAVTLEKGEDPRFYTLLPFGGAGAMVSTLLADRLGIKHILIPPFQGVFSALGMLVADYQKDFSRSFLKGYSPGIEEVMKKIYAGMINEATKVLREDGFNAGRSLIKREVDIRYKGQSFELTIPFQKNFIRAFHVRHQTLYSYRLEDRDCEVVNLRALAVGVNPKIRITKAKIRSGNPGFLEKRKIYYNRVFQDFFVYQRKDLFPGSRLRVPALVVSDHSTVVIDRHFSASVDEYSNLSLTRMKTAGR